MQEDAHISVVDSQAVLGICPEGALSSNEAQLHDEFVPLAAAMSGLFCPPPILGESRCHVTHFLGAVLLVVAGSRVLCGVQLFLDHLLESLVIYFLVEVLFTHFFFLQNFE